jgi:hypothetical protein
MRESAELQTQATGEVSPVVEQAFSVEVVDQGSAQLAADMLTQIKAARSTVTGIFGDPKRKAWDAHKSIVAAEKEVLAPLDEADKWLRDQTAQYYRRLEEQANEERRIREAAARAQAEAEKQARMMEAASNGDVAKVRDIDRTPTAAFVDPELLADDEPDPDVEGLSVRRTWDVEVTDIKALATAVGAGSATASFLRPDLAKIRSYVRATDGAATIPGVKITRKIVPVVR